MKEDFKEQSDVEKLSPAIIDVIETAKEFDVDCWLNYGALLGIVREKRLLPWNNDAELSCWYTDGIENKFKLITDSMNRKGYNSVYYSSVGSFSVKAQGVIVNVNLIWREGDNGVRPHETPQTPNTTPFMGRLFYWLATFMCAYPSGIMRGSKHLISLSEFVKSILISFFRILNVTARKKCYLKFLRISRYFGAKYQKTAIPIQYIRNTVYYDFYNSKVLVPENPENLIRFIYGKEWNIPKENWSFYTESNKEDSGIIFIDKMWDYSNMEIV
jgi:hypothetical protein